MKIKKLKILAPAIVMVLGFYTTFTKVFAEGVSSSVLSVSPPNQQIILMPGETYHGSILVSTPNNAEGNLDYSVSIGSFSQYKTDDSKDDYGGASSDIITSYNQIMDWISLEKTSGSVAPNTSEKVPFTIKVPADAPAGGQYATIIVKNETKINNSSNGNVSIQNVAQLASIIYAEVTGETRKEATITDNNIPSFLTNSKLEATSMVKNNGNIHASASYTLQVWPLFSDEEICTNEEKAEASLILPGTERYHVQSCDLPAFGIFRTKQVVKIFGEISEIEKTIIICPIWLMVLILAIIVVIIVVIIAFIKKHKKSSKETAE